MHDKKNDLHGYVIETIKGISFHYRTKIKVDSNGNCLLNLYSNSRKNKHIPIKKNTPRLVILFSLPHYKGDILNLILNLTLLAKLYSF